MSELNNLDLNLLKALHILLQEKNVSRAAERLHLTQPAVSSMLNRLRYHFDDPLFVRSSRGIVPTDRALALAEPLKQIMSQIQMLTQPTKFDPKTLNTVIKIGATDNGTRSIGIPFSLQLQSIAPNVKTAFFAIQGRDDLAMLLEKGVLDMAIISEKAALPNLHSRLIYHERYVCAVRQNHPVLREVWDLDAFCRLDFVLMSYFGGAFLGATDKALAQMGKTRNVMMSVNNFLLIPDILKQSDYAAVVPHHLLKDNDGLAVLEMPFWVEGYDKLLVWHERHHQDPIQRWIREYLLQSVVQAA